MTLVSPSSGLKSPIPKSYVRSLLYTKSERNIMFVQIIINLMALFMLLGCGFMFDKNKKSSDDPKVSDEIKSFAIGMTKGNSVESVLQKSISFSEKTDELSKVTLYQKKSIESCPSGGSVSLDEDESKSDVLLLTIIADECIEDGVKSSYSAFVKVVKRDENLFKTEIILKENAIFEEIETTITTILFKGSTLIIDELSPNEAMVTDNVKVASSLVDSYESINLKSYQQQNENNDTSYEISGQHIYNGVTYSVDESYDGSKTPMVVIYQEDDAFLVSGKAKYYNKKGEHITIEVIKKDTIKVSVDRDNNEKDDAVTTIFI